MKISDNSEIRDNSNNTSPSTINNDLDDSINELALLININNKPNTYKEALESPNNKE